MVGPDVIATFAEGADTRIAVPVVSQIKLQNRGLAGYKVTVNAETGALGLGGERSMENGRMS